MTKTTIYLPEVKSNLEITSDVIQRSPVDDEGVINWVYATSLISRGGDFVVGYGVSDRVGLYMAIEEDCNPLVYLYWIYDVYPFEEGDDDTDLADCIEQTAKAHTDTHKVTIEEVLIDEVLEGVKDD